jgi:DHA1 family tetracycline resistance protein-like MFS transporter
MLCMGWVKIGIQGKKNTNFAAITTMESPEKKRSAPLGPALLAAFVDMLGIGIIIPVIAPLIVDNETGIVPASYSPFWRDIILGVLLTCYPLAQFFGAPILGALSDRYGRKPMLALSMTGSVIGFLITAWGIYDGSLALVFFGRILDGVTGGNISIVYSAIADVSTPETRTRNFGLVGMLFGLGFIIGPALGGVLSDSNIVSWFGPAIPFLAAAALSAINVILIVLIFRETIRERNMSPISLTSGLRDVATAFTLPKLGNLFQVLFLATLGFAFFTSFFSVLMIKKFSYEESDLGWLFFFVGIWIAAVQGGLVKPVSQRFKNIRVLNFSLPALAVVLLCLLLPNRDWMIYALMPFLALSQGLFGPFMQSLISETAENNQQGLVLGIGQSVGALGNAVPPLLAGVLSGLNYNLPIVAAGFFTFLAWVVLRLGKR